ncbi:ribokinase-like isoform X2 [Dendronephthya gigantea]|uniref:ribokinase-like isoform X2 n=1 Tax=Dendronephthya gigantea TaxID=151771 RepID=UPI00106A1EDF|nr:ribokinase-like isoform X2 [Dendronephthya gigantea]
MEIFKVIKDRRFDVVVVGSCFCDLQTYIRNLPKPGETVLSEKFQMDFGGKGANTCVMAAKLGARTAMISSIGDDVFGRETLANFHKFGVHTECVKITSDAATGITNCIVNEDGEPSYISVPGAGKCLSISNINDAKHIIEQGKIVISNNGIPLSTAIEGLKLGKHYGAITMYNPSPNLHEMPDDLCSNMDILLLNTTEATTLTKIKVSGPSDAEDACAWFHDKGIQCVVMTMGKDGVVVSAVCLESADKVKHCQRRTYSSERKSLVVCLLVFGKNAVSSSYSSRCMDETCFMWFPFIFDHAVFNLPIYVRKMRGAFGAKDTVRELSLRR